MHAAEPLCIAVGHSVTRQISDGALDQSLHLGDRMSRDSKLRPRAEGSRKIHAKEMLTSLRLTRVGLRCMSLLKSDRTCSVQLETLVRPQVSERCEKVLLVF